jgi:hypothetical protein
VAPFSTLALVPLTALLLAQGAHAQGSACDQFKATLAARIDPSIRGFALDTVPAATPVPPGAKVIGTCEGGAYKILLRRSAGAPSASGSAAVADGPASTPTTGPVTAAPIKPVPIKPPANETASIPPKPLASDVNALAPASAAAAKTAYLVEPAVAPPIPLLPDATPAQGASLAQRASGFLGHYWYGFAALALVIFGPALWRWFAHHRAYDASGLPRGPRIR